MDPSTDDIFVGSSEGNLTQFLNDIAFDDAVATYISETKNLPEVSTYKCVDGTIHCKSISEIISARKFYACLENKNSGYFMVLLHITTNSDDTYSIQHVDPLTGQSVCITTTADDLELLIGCKKLYIDASNV